MSPYTQRLTDTEIVHAVITGGKVGEACLIFLYQSYRNPIIASFKFFVPDRYVREDIYSESFLDLIEAIKQGKYNPQKGFPLRNFLWGIYKHKIFRWLQTGKLRYISADGQLEAQIPDIHSDYNAQLFSKSAWRKVEHVFKSLSKDCQQAIGLRYGVFGWEQRKVYQIAELLNKTPKNTSNYISRCQAHFFRLLITDKDPAIKELVLQELKDPRRIMQLDSYWEKAASIIKYLDHEMSEEEEEIYQEEKLTDPELAVFEGLVKKWGRTRMGSEEGLEAEELSSLKEHAVILRIDLKERKLMMRKLRMLVSQQLYI